jgi:MFS transporter, UMF1 family
VFAWPVLLFTPEPGSRRVAIAQATMAGIRRLRHLVGELRDRPDIARFLLAHMIYADGLTTVFAFGGIYAAGVFGMSLGEVVQFGILLNVMAGAGAFGFAWLDDRLGSRRTIAVALVGIIAAATAAVSVQDRLSFWIAGAALGLFVGPAQASSRALMARLMPADRRGEYFGLFALSGKATAFAGPILVGALTALFSSQRAGLASVLAFFTVGLALLLTVREPSRA